MNEGLNEETTLGSILIYSSQKNWEPEDFYGLWRYLNRLFQNKKGARDLELSSLDLDRMTHNTTYLMKHMLINISMLDAFIEKFPNLAGLREVKRIPKILYLDRNPSGINLYFSVNGIFL